MPTLPGSRGSSGRTSRDFGVVEADFSHGAASLPPPRRVPRAPPGSVRPVATLSKEVQEAFRTLPSRYLGAEPGFDATYHVRLGDVGHTWEIRCTTHGARVRMGATLRRPDVTIGTDAETWCRLRQGELSGIEAFSQRLLYARGELDLALGFEGLFRLPDGRPPLLRIRDVPVGRLKVSTLTMGEGPEDVLLLHGLGGDEVLVLRHRGRAQPPLPRPRARLPRLRRLQQAPAGRLRRRLLRPHGRRGDGRAGHRPRARGRQLDGRAGRDRARARAPGARRRPRAAVPGHRVRAARLAAARARPAARGRAAAALASARSRIEAQFWSLFADRDLVDPTVADIAVDEFERIYRSAGARLAFLTAARNIYLEKPFGKGGFYPRLAQLEPPAMFVWSSHDKLIPPAFQRHVERWLPSAEQILLEGCGHVPQVERPERTNGLLERFFARIDALGRARRLEARVTATTTNGHGSPDTARGRLRARRRRGRARGGRRPARLRAGRRQGLRGGPDPARRPGRARPGLHPREPPAALAAVLAVLPRRGARARQRPRGGRRAARGQPLGRQPHAGHDRLHARLLDLLRGRARASTSSPTTSCSRSRACPTCASTGRWRPRTRTPARRWRRARRCSSTRAATTRSTGRAGSATGSTSAAARASSGSRSTRTCRSCRWSPSAGRRPRCSSRAASRWRRCSGSTGCCG